LFLANGIVCCGITLWLSHRLRLQPVSSPFTGRWAYIGIAAVFGAGVLIAVLAILRDKRAPAFAILILMLVGVETANRQLLPQWDRLYSLRFAQGALLY